MDALKIFNPNLIEKIKKTQINQKKLNYGMVQNLGPLISKRTNLARVNHQSKKVRNKMGFMRNGGEVMMVQGRGCGAMMQSKRKKTRVPRS